MEEVKNAKIDSVSITMADHGCLTFYLGLSGGGWGCSMGGYCIGHGYLGSEHFDGYGRGLEAIARIMNTVGVERWEDLPGKFCRVVTGGWGSIIHKIGHITDDQWFDLKEFFDQKENP